MSFKLKVLITNIMLMAVSLGVIGYLMIHNSYRVSMDMQMDRAMEEHQMVVSAVESAVVDLLVNDSFYSMEQIGEIGEEIAGTVEGTGTRFCFLDGERQYIYTNGEELDFNWELLDYLERGKRNYTIEEQDQNEILTIASLIRVNDSNMYLVNQRDISDIYRENEKQIRFFQIIMAAALIVCGGAISVISWWLTKPIEQLNNTASVIASGDYSVRTQLISNDEIGELAEKFDSMAEAIEGHVQELKDHARQQEDFVASFTHEIKTPMTAVIGYADMLRSKEMEKEQQILTANYIFQEGKRLESMSLKLFDLIALKRKDIEKQKIYAQVFGEEIQDSILPILEREDISFSVDMQPAILEGDRDLLKTVFINLVDNARKASKPGDEIRMCGIWNRESEGSPLYEIQVQDDGCGIPEEEVNKICEAFYMVDKSRARKQGGAGLGLATTSLIIEVHQGRFLIESTVGKGTTMRVLLPGKEMDTNEA
ncbi:MAG: HAMP domain-containing histidine kinase [Lachnospiraceae bacterium]|nr:HAMP domain-containing histidine kinase [Lachnospiraceae bacterium]